MESLNQFENPSLLPVIILPLPGPLCGCVSIYHEMSTFSPPLSDRTHDGNPYSPTASTNRPRTVSALLLSDAHRYTGILEYLPIPQSCKTIHHLLTFRKCKVAESLKNKIITGL